MNKIVVLVGMPGSGKSVASDHLRSFGFAYLRFGQVTIDELERRGLPVNEVNERSVREELRAKHGMGAYAQLLLPKIQEMSSRQPLVLDGLYSWSEYQFLKSRVKDISVVAIISDKAIRYERLAHRSVRPLTKEEAESRDVAEIERLEKGGPIAIADFAVLNNGSTRELHRQIDRILGLISPSPL